MSVNQWGEQPPALQLAHACVSALAAAGVTEWVLCPGSRSAPLAYVLAQAEAAGQVRVHICADERSAAFYAVGISKAVTSLEGVSAGFPAVVTTSGTAVANLHPAVLEASHSNLPLFIVSADRPHELRGTGANQTTEQVGIFGSAPIFTADVPAGYPCAKVGSLIRRAVSAALGLLSNQPGVAHLNLCFSLPLTPNFPMPEFAEVNSRPLPAMALGMGASSGDYRATTLPVDFTQPHTVVIAGDGAGPEAALVAASLHWPLLAEPTSGARPVSCEADFVPDLVAPVGYLELLGIAQPTPLAQQIRQVLVWGHPTLSRPISRLISQCPQVVAVADYAHWTDLTDAGAEVVLRSQLLTTLRDRDWIGPSSQNLDWLERWRPAREVGQTTLHDLALGDPRAAAVAQIWRQCAADNALLFIGSSSAIRLFDRFAGALEPLPQAPANQSMDLGAPDLPPSPPFAFANRGLAGIDGNVATARGIAAATGAPMRIVVGDLTLLHDLTSLLSTFAAQHPSNRAPASPLQVILFDDGGGSIFAGLEHAKAPAPLFSRYFRTPQRFNYEAAAQAFGINYCRLSGQQVAVKLPSALQFPPDLGWDREEPGAITLIHLDLQ